MSNRDLQRSTAIWIIIFKMHVDLVHSLQTNYFADGIYTRFKSHYEAPGLHEANKNIYLLKFTLGPISL